MFEEMVVSNPTNKKTNKPWTVFSPWLFRSCLLAILILIPLIYTEALPKTMMSSILAGAASASAASAASGRRAGGYVKPSVHLMDAGKLVHAESHPEGRQDY